MSVRLWRRGEEDAGAAACDCLRNEADAARETIPPTAEEARRTDVDSRRFSSAEPIKATADEPRRSEENVEDVGASGALIGAAAEK